MKPTEEQSKALSASFNFLNEFLFEGKLKAPMLLFSRNKNVIGGYFSPDKWENEDGCKVHEIAINANIMEADIVDLLSILAHEMCHLWQHDHGKPSRNGYHNQEWAEKMLSIGLRPFGPDGTTMTGQQISHEVMLAGAFSGAVLEFPEEAIFPWRASVLQDSEEKKPQIVVQQSSGKRSKYTCPVCGLNAWAKAGVNIMCGECSMELIEQVKGE